MMSDKYWMKGTVPDIKPSLDKIDLCEVSSLGSCFSRNLYRWLSHNNVINADNTWDVFFNPFSILAEFKRLFGNINWQNNIIEENLNTAKKYIDPWRTWNYADTIEELFLKNKKLDELAYNQLSKTKTILITYGLIEVWRKKNEKHIYFNNLPNRVIIENKKKSEYISEIASSFDTYNAIYETINIIINIFGPNVNIILTLSPVPLKFTFSDMSVRQANNISKSRLLLAIFEVCNNFKNVSYFPSYEIVQGYSELDYGQVWQSDNRHITAKMIDIIADKFIDFCSFKVDKSLAPFYVPLVNENGSIIGQLFSNGNYKYYNEKSF